MPSISGATADVPRITACSTRSRRNLQQLVANWTGGGGVSSDMATVHPNTITYPFSVPDGLELDDRYLAAQRAPGMLKVQLPHGEPTWLATRYADVRLVLSDPRFSRAEALRRDEPRLSEWRVSNGLLSMDPPDHSRLRKLITKAFTMRRVEGLRAQIRQLANDLVDDMVDDGAPADLVETFALPLPIAVICELLGVPAQDRRQFRRWSDNWLSTNSRLSQSDMAVSMSEMSAYMADLIAQKRREPRDDLITALIQARDEQDRLNEAELIHMCAGLLVAGHETTASQISNFVYTLLDHPDQLAKLRSDQTLLAGAVEELLRFVPLGNGSAFARYATEDAVVGDVLVRAGEPVLPALGAANRDAMRFDDAGELRIERPASPHIGFGYGVHHCVGAPLARVELQEALRVLLDRLPGLRLAADVTWKKAMLVRGAESMPVSW